MVAGERETEAHGLASPERALCLERREEVGKTRPSISLIACGARACRARRSLPLSARPHALPHPTSDLPPPPFLAVCDAPSLRTTGMVRGPVTREWQNARVSPTLATETNVTHSLSLSLAPGRACHAQHTPPPPSPGGGRVIVARSMLLRGSSARARRPPHATDFLPARLSLFSPPRPAPSSPLSSWPSRPSPCLQPRPAASPAGP